MVLWFRGNEKNEKNKITIFALIVRKNTKKNVITSFI